MTISQCHPKKKKLNGRKHQKQPVPVTHVARPFFIQFRILQTSQTMISEVQADDMSIPLKYLIISGARWQKMGSAQPEK